MRLTISWSAEFIQSISFFFSLRSLCGIILEFGFLSYAKLCSWFFDEQRQLLVCLHPKQKHIMCLHPLTTKWQLFMLLHPVTTTNLFSVVLKFTTCFFGGLFFGTNHGRRFASPLTLTWLIESEALPRPYQLVMIERVGERDGLSFHSSAYYNSCWRSESRTPSPITQQMC